MSYFTLDDDVVTCILLSFEYVLPPYTRGENERPELVQTTEDQVLEALTLQDDISPADGQIADAGAPYTLKAPEIKKRRKSQARAASGVGGTASGAAVRKKKVLNVRGAKTAEGDRATPDHDVGYEATMTFGGVDVTKIKIPTKIPPAQRDLTERLQVAGDYSNALQKIEAMGRDVCIDTISSNLCKKELWAFLLVNDSRCPKKTPTADMVARVLEIIQHGTVQAQNVMPVPDPPASGEHDLKELSKQPQDCAEAGKAVMEKLEIVAQNYIELTGEAIGLSFSNKDLHTLLRLHDCGLPKSSTKQVLADRVADLLRSGRIPLAQGKLLSCPAKQAGIQTERPLGEEQLAAAGTVRLDDDPKPAGGAQALQLSTTDVAAAGLLSLREDTSDTAVPPLSAIAEQSQVYLTKSASLKFDSQQISEPKRATSAAAGAAEDGSTSDQIMAGAISVHDMHYMQEKKSEQHKRGCKRTAAGSVAAQNEQNTERVNGGPKHPTKKSKADKAAADDAVDLVLSPPTEMERGALMAASCRALDALNALRDVTPEAIEADIRGDDISALLTMTGLRNKKSTKRGRCEQVMELIRRGLITLRHIHNTKDIFAVPISDPRALRAALLAAEHASMPLISGAFALDGYLLSVLGSACTDTRAISVSLAVLHRELHQRVYNDALETFAAKVRSMFEDAGQTAAVVSWEEYMKEYARLFPN